jgi:hypothetical protein
MIIYEQEWLDSLKNQFQSLASRMSELPELVMKKV